MTRKIKVALIDYGMGNLRSVAKALETAGAAVRRVHSPSGLKTCGVVVLPGVGAFGRAVRNLKKRSLFDPLRRWIEKGKPFLGICLGYQLLFESSEESSAGLKGLGVLRGKVRKLPRKKNLKIPHMGWNTVRAVPADRRFYRGIPDESYFYFVHSYVPVPEDPSVIAAETRYGVPFVSSVASGNLLAMQFHPEKSGGAGLRLLKNFLKGVSQ